MGWRNLMFRVAHKFDSKQARWELGKERVKRMMDAKDVCADAR
ncbi:hypothetical protein HanPSC8_Chr17g0795631 [Helianthus annuus]|nr:hypothetical protein HanPSC8_Chr17g0795631 [Helianthus annuus]